MTREEQYLAKIAGEDIETPEPTLRKEQYLNHIANESGEIPELPVTREERYLAVLAGEDYEIPAPYNRIEQYMAKACGLEIEVPVPITRVEQLWAKIAEGGSWTVTEITGTLPLTFLSKGDDLIDYRIYGTSAGAGVETENLFAPEDVSFTISNVNFVFENGQITVIGTSTANISSVNAKFKSNAFRLTAGTYYYKAFSIPVSVSLALYEIDGTATKTIVSVSDALEKSFVLEQDADVFWGAYIPANITINGTVLISITPGSTAPTSYIPPGYKLPMMVESGEESTTTPIYIGDSKLMAEEYVDYESGKIYRKVNNVLTPTDPPVALPELSTYQGENTLSCSETLGEVSITGYIKEVSNG